MARFSLQGKLKDDLYSDVSTLAMKALTVTIPSRGYFSDGRRPLQGPRTLALVLALALALAPYGPCSPEI